VKCSTDCTVRVVSYLNTCRSTWDYSLGNLSNGGGNRNFRKGPDFNGILGRSSSNKCNYYKYEKEEKEIIGSGTIAFRGDITSEGPAYVEVDDGLFNSPTGSISYSVFQTQIKIARVVKEAHDYPTMFGNLTTQKRFEPYVAFNRFSENMTGEYEIEADYRPSKETLTWVGYGFAIATGAAAAVALLGLIGAILGACLDKSDSSSEKTSQPSEEEKTPQDATPAAAVPAGDAQPQMADEELPQVVTKELRQVIMEEIDKLRHSSDEIVKSLKDQIAHLTSENPASDESVMEEIASIGSVCEQLQQQNTTLSQQLTNQYDQYSKLSRDKMAMELRLSELERDLKQAQQDRMAAMEQLHQQVQMNSQFVVQDRAQSQELFDEKQKSLALASRIEQESGARVVAESDVENLKRKMNEIQKQLDEKGVELTRCSGEKDNLEKEVKREVMGLVWVYRYKLKFALTLLSNSGSAPGGASSSTATSPSKSRWKKNASTSSGSGGPQSRMNLRPEYKSLLPPEDEEIDKFEVSGRALLGSSSADSDGTMVDEDLGSLYRQLVKCSVCGERDRSCVLKRCSHTFCEQCITKCLQNRNRKCPKCHAPFGDADVIKFIL